MGTLFVLDFGIFLGYVTKKEYIYILGFNYNIRPSMNLMRRWHNNFITTMIYRLAEHNSLQMTNLTVCLDGFEPGLIYIGPVQVSPE